MLNKAFHKACKHSSGGRQRIWAIATDKRGRVVAEGGNSYVVSHPKQADYARRAGRNQACFLHAEISVLISLYRVKKVCHTLYIARAKKNAQGVDVPGLAKPCEICAKALAEAGITKIIWTEG